MAQVETIRIDDGTWRIDNGDVRCFLLQGKKRALLVDSGKDIPSVRAIAEGLTTLPLTLINTHADPDHIGGNDEFPSFMMHPSEGVNYFKEQKRIGIMVPVYDSDVIDLGEREIEVLNIPGHTPGSIALLDRSRGVVYSGDAVQNGSIYLFGPMRDIHAYIAGLNRFEKWKGQYDIVYPSHGTFPVSPSLIPRLIDGARRVMRHEIEGVNVRVHGKKAVSYDIGCAVLLWEE